ncbi:MAG: hypothetical protein M4579_005727 [Chaenotheca gracillima]|nr:MAG: hypothetical protein M4579_005727 [Chaenotheca gracillima]
MGNNPSRASSAAGAHPPPSSSSGASSTSRAREPRRRDSIQALSAGKATAAPPSESLESATGHSSSSASARPTPSRSRPRSRTNEHSQQRPSQPAPPTAADAAMGNEQSRQQDEFAHSRGEGAREGEIENTAAAKPFSPSRPMDVPASAEAANRTDSVPMHPAAPPQDLYYIPPSQAQRPPRLPLPIEEEVHTPGSPIISPADVSTVLDDDDIVEDALPRKTSVLSSTTVDEDDIGEDLQAYPVEGAPGMTVPTMVEWKNQGDRVYVTGTFANWNKKFRLHKTESREGLSAVIPLPPGTHHLKFIVDGDMRTSDDLPTAVDYTNILVNYIEVRADPIPSGASKSGAGLPDSEKDQHESQSHSKPPPGMHPPQVLPPSPTTKSRIGSHGDAISTPGARPKAYTNRIPQYLLDLDAPEDSPAYSRASSAISQLPPPPSLPMFLGKSILNGSTPMKDDSSVLNMPNHTVLNHLATSSIKNNVLATSGTTRYKHKYITTVMYKPTNEEGD